MSSMIHTCWFAPSLQFLSYFAIVLNASTSTTLYLHSIWLFDTTNIKRSHESFSLMPPASTLDESIATSSQDDRFSPRGVRCQYSSFDEATKKNLRLQWVCGRVELVPRRVRDRPTARNWALTSSYDVARHDTLVSYFHLMGTQPVGVCPRPGVSVARKNSDSD